MSRPTPDIVADLRDHDIPTAAERWHLRLEAAGRLTELDDEQNVALDHWRSKWQKELEALRPPCPTCDGRATLINADPATHPGDGQLHYIPCPDCPDDGKVSIEQLAATWRRVWKFPIEDREHPSWAYDEGWRACIDHLRAVKP